MVSFYDAVTRNYAEGELQIKKHLVRASSYLNSFKYFFKSTQVNVGPLYTEMVVPPSFYGYDGSYVYDFPTNDSVARIAFAFVLTVRRRSPRRSSFCSDAVTLVGYTPTTWIIANSCNAPSQ